MTGAALGYAAWTMHGKRVATAGRATAGTGWLQIAACLYVFLGLVFGASAPFVLAFYADNGYLPTLFFFRALSGPVEELGRQGFLAAGFVLVAASAVSVVAGLLLWHGERRGVQLALLVDPIAFVLGLGFALPLLLVGVPLRSGLVLANRWQARRAPLGEAGQP